MDQKILGLVQRPSLPGAPGTGDAYVRHLVRSLEEQRNVALSAVADILAEYEQLKEQYTAHVQNLTADLANSAENLRKARLEIEQLKGEKVSARKEPKASGNVNTKRKPKA